MHVGALKGSKDGRGDGIAMGCMLGIVYGAAVGEPGATVGSSVGFAVGAAPISGIAVELGVRVIAVPIGLQLLVGVDGSCVCWTDGCAVGDPVGSFDCDGSEDGFGVVGAEVGFEVVGFGVGLELGRGVGLPAA